MVVLPHLKEQMVAGGGAEAAAGQGAGATATAVAEPRVGVESEGAPTSFHYQRPPTIRLQPPDPIARCRPHADAVYGHQVTAVYSSMGTR